MERVWVFSPNAVLANALEHYVASLGFDAALAPDGAAAAVFDLTSYDRSLPPAPVIPCIAIIGSTDPTTVTEVVKLGYRGVQRPCDDEARLGVAVKMILAGASAFPVVSAGGGIAEDDDHRPGLTAREAQVLSLVMLGLPNKRIAGRLGIAERTVKHHMSILMNKYQARGRLSLVLKARTPGLP